VDGVAAPAASKTALVSSIFHRPDGFYVDATQEKIRLGTGYTEFSDSSTTWQRLETNPDSSGLMGECLSSNQRYIRQAKAE
jgi:hypothetical protein